MKTKILSLCLLLSLAMPATAQTPTEAFINVTDGDNQIQGMALALANQMAEQKTPVRVLLCGPAGRLGLKAHESAALKPRNISPKQMMAGLIKAGATVEVCALFLPNSDKTVADLADGVTVAKPAEVAAHMLKPNVRTFGF